MNNKKNIIFLTGKAGCGKDTLANHISSRNMIPHIKLSQPLIDCMMTLFNVEDEYIATINENRSLKEQPSDVFGGKSYRECVIWLAEECVKPKFGKSFFVDNLLRRIQQKKFKDTFIVSDLGFKYDELSNIDRNKYNVFVIKIERPGIEEVNDSRVVVDDDVYATLTNNGSIEEFLTSGRMLVDKIMKEINDVKRI